MLIVLGVSKFFTRRVKNVCLLWRYIRDVNETKYILCDIWQLANIAYKTNLLIVKRKTIFKIKYFLFPFFVSINAGIFRNMF